MVRFLLAFAALLVAGGVGFLVYMAYMFFTSKPPGYVPDDSTSPACRTGDPLRGVYNPWRLKVIKRCITVTGTVIEVAAMADGDDHINLLPDPPFVPLLNRKNYTRQQGALVLETIPMDRAVVRRPAAGDRVMVTGVYVLDRLHGWMEIHPVWEIKKI